MKSPLFQIFPSLIILFFFNYVHADDFIKMANRKSWKVQDCAVDGDSYKVKVCYANEFCKNKYPTKEYSCEKGIACGENFIGSSDFYKGNKTKRFQNIKKIDQALSAAIPFSKLQDVDSQAWQSLSSSWPSMDIPIILYSSKPGENTVDAVKELAKKAPTNTLVFSISKDLNKYELKSITSKPAAYVNPNAKQLEANNAQYDQLIALLTKALTQELSDCPE